MYVAASSCGQFVSYEAPYSATTNITSVVYCTKHTCQAGIYIEQEVSILNRTLMESQLMQTLRLHQILGVIEILLR